MARKKKLSPLKYLVLTLREVERLRAAGAKAEKKAICRAAVHLTNYACIHRIDVDGAARVCGPKGVKYEGWDYESYSDVLHRDGMNYYHAMFEATCGYFDERLDCSLLDGGGQVEVPKKWKKVLKAMTEAVPATFKPGELLRVARLAREELRAARQQPLAPLVAYAPTKADGWSKANAAAQLARLAAYRDGNKPKPRKAAPVADLITWHEGEPGDRFVTKVGGLPYRPAKLPWPARDGEPMTFLAQVCFADSADLVSRFDDVLLVFAAGEDACAGGPRGANPPLRFEWYPLGMTKLVEADVVPATTWKLLPCYARVERVAEKGGPVEGPKIGGGQFVVQHPHTGDDELIVTLGQVRLTETAKQTRAGYRHLRLADDGLLGLFLQPDYRLTWDLQSY